MKMSREKSRHPKEPKGSGSHTGFGHGMEYTPGGRDYEGSCMLTLSLMIVIPVTFAILLSRLL